MGNEALLNSTTLDSGLSTISNSKHSTCGSSPCSNFSILNLLFIKNLNQSSIPFQELQILGSDNSSGCVAFALFSDPNHPATTVSSNSDIYQNVTAYCNGSVFNGPYYDTNHRKLPPGYFLICGDRAWPGIPAMAFGGPCYLGKLTLFSPTMKNLLKDIKNSSTIGLRSKRSLTQLGPNCNPNLHIWDHTARFLAAFLWPQLAAGKALADIHRLACWASIQLNITLAILSSLAINVDSVRRATLQNRAAIDFLLLAHGHGCEDFEGMCCMNLSDHSESIHKSLENLCDNMKLLQVQSSPWDEWLGKWGITRWLKELLKQSIIILGVLLMVIIIIPCIIQCAVQKMQQVIKPVWLVQDKQKRGIVGSFLEENGHAYMEME